MNGPLRRNPYAAIVRAAEQGVGVRLAPEEAALLAADPTIAARARLAANVTRAPRAGDDRARLPRPATYGRDRFGHPMVRSKWIEICRCAQRHGPEGGVCGACSGAIPTPEEAKMMQRDR